eukprot:m51a1_g3324 putative pin domain-like protein (524) ;mRNA; r:359779-362129
MGIQGLLPLLENATRDAHLSELKGQRAAVDGYCWLHRAVFSCSLELCTGTPTTRWQSFVKFMLGLLRHYGVVPFVVLDGAPLPAKRLTEVDRRTRRDEEMAKGMQCLREGDRAKATGHFQKAVDITPQLAREFVMILREMQIEYVVAPYEADAQLAYLALNGIVDFVITEDSDLVPYGVRKVMFKLEKNGDGRLFDADLLRNCEDQLGDAVNSVELLRSVCILSGCDYAKAPKGVGLRTAVKMIKKHGDPIRAIRASALEQNISFPLGYEATFREAMLTFQHQIVFDPRSQLAVPLTPPETAEDAEIAAAVAETGKDLPVVVRSRFFDRMSRDAQYLKPDTACQPVEYVVLGQREQDERPCEEATADDGKPEERSSSPKDEPDAGDTVELDCGDPPVSEGAVSTGVINLDDDEEEMQDGEPEKPAYHSPFTAAKRLTMQAGRRPSLDQFLFRCDSNEQDDCQVSPASSGTTSSAGAAASAVSSGRSSSPAPATPQAKPAAAGRLSAFMFSPGSAVQSTFYVVE